jgi:hypothetical protein
MLEMSLRGQEGYLENADVWFNFEIDAGFDVEATPAGI